SPADGTLIVENPDEEYPLVNHPSGDIYQTEGYRLPTVAESERMMCQMGVVFVGEFVHGLSSEQLENRKRCAIGPST
ncbi:MAG: hypothetical protein AB7K41_08890, partial [Bdellovibrionales bacterium]